MVGILSGGLYVVSRLSKTIFTSWLGVGELILARSILIQLQVYLTNENPDLHTTTSVRIGGRAVGVTIRQFGMA
jgi:hypothetical protein